MGSLSLNPAPTFIAEVGIPVPGGEPHPVKFTFKHRARDEIVEWHKSTAERDDDVGLFREFVLAWDLDDAFTDENIARLLNNYPGASSAITVGYLRELRGVRAKN